MISHPPLLPGDTDPVPSPSRVLVRLGGLCRSSSFSSSVRQPALPGRSGGGPLRRGSPVYLSIVAAVASAAGSVFRASGGRRGTPLARRRRRRGGETPPLIGRLIGPPLGGCSSFSPSSFQSPDHRRGNMEQSHGYDQGGQAQQGGGEPALPEGQHAGGGAVTGQRHRRPAAFEGGGVAIFSSDYPNVQPVGR